MMKLTNGQGESDLICSNFPLFHHQNKKATNHTLRAVVMVLLCYTLMLPVIGEAGSPNVILVMADDLGWSDTGFNGNRVVQTPHLDQMASNGLVFDRFYSAAPVCSPTRGSCLTGRHPYRYGIPTANAGHILEGEWTLAELLKAQGYRTGHFGKWHLGTLTKSGRDSNRGGDRNHQHFAPPTQHGFDTYFSTEAKTPTWDPLWSPKKHNRTWWDPVSAKERAIYGTAYWTPEGKVEESLEGDDSRVIMDRALKFIEGTVREEVPFFTVIWFHAPHLPVVSGEKWTKPYETLGGYHKHYYGCISALDHQIGRLRKSLKEWKVSDNTMVWFCSDNGPEGKSFQAPGSAWPLNGRKRSLHDGGIRVPAVLEWPKHVAKGKRTNMPAVTSDYLPTIADILDVTLPNRPYDGQSLRHLITDPDGHEVKLIKDREIGFQSGKQYAWMKGSLKYYSPDQGKTDFLFNLDEDISESVNLAEKMPDVLRGLKQSFHQWKQSTKKSASGAHY